MESLHDSQKSYYIKTFFSFDAEYPMDGLLYFRPGDILRVINSTDPDWWVASRVDKETCLDVSEKCLIPSIGRAARILKLRRKKVRFDESMREVTHDSCQFNCYDFLFKSPRNYFPENGKIDTSFNPYIKVVKVDSEFDRPVLIFGASSLRISHDLMKTYPGKFRAPIPHTTREPKAGEVDGRDYYFCGSEKFMNTKFIEMGSFNKQKYGVSVDEVMKIIKSKFICLLELQPVSIINLVSSGIYPIVIFIRIASYVDSTFAESDIHGLRSLYEENVKFERDHSHLFTEVIEDDSLSSTYEKVRDAIEKNSNRNIWISRTLY